MWLKELYIRNYRSCRNTSVVLNEDLTVLVGPNGQGKSNIVDAIRLGTFEIPNTENLRFDPVEDISKPQTGVPISEIKLRFADLSPDEAADFSSYISDGDHLVLTTELNGVDTTPDRHRVSRRLGDPPYKDERELSDRIAHLYLPPLRDAVGEMEKGFSRRLVRLLRELSSPEQLEELETSSSTLLRELSHIEAIKNLQGLIQSHLSKLTHPIDEQTITLEGSELAIDQLLRLINIFLASMDFDPMAVSAAGLGYANLLYIATILISLEKDRENYLQILLVEEPEAHLHPQLQSVLLRYLLQRSRSEPNIQVIVTTHSPNIASSVPIQNVIKVSSSEELTTGSAPSTGTKCNRVANANLSSRDLLKINRFLDATKSSLLFANSVILVEGVSELMLVSTIAQRKVFAHDVLLAEKFQGVTPLAVGSTDFEPWIDLLLGGETPLVRRLIVVTDGDGQQGQARKVKYETKHTSHVESGCLSIHVAATTLEAELFGHEENSELLRNTFLEMHPRSAMKWDQIAASATGGEFSERAALFETALKNELSDLSKGEFAQRIAQKIDEDPNVSFVCPIYLRTAIERSILSALT